MYTYLNQKYGLKGLIVDWASAILNGVKLYSQEDHDVMLFDKILKNECDEEFRFIEHHLRESMFTTLKMIIKEKYQFKSESDIAKLADTIAQGQMALEEWIWRRMLEKLYDESDYENLNNRLLTCIESKKKRSSQTQRRGDAVVMLQGNRKLSRDELKQALLSSSKVNEMLLYNDMIRTVLDFQLHEHLKFLFRFTVVFKLVDQDGNGILSEEEFRLLLLERL